MNIPTTVQEYRNRFKTSKRKLPKGIIPIFSVGDEITVDVAYAWKYGVPFQHIPERVIIDCMDDYAIVCRYKESNHTILIIDYKGLRSGKYIIDNEILKRLQA